MRDSSKMKALIKQEEGCSHELYLDSLGNLTGGYGHHFALGSSISTQVINLFFKQDFLNASNEANALVKNLNLPWLNPARMYVLITMIFVLGLPKTSLFVKFFRALKESDYNEAAFELKASLWYHQATNRVERLRVIMKSGEFPNG